jgi:hypothetical protein
MANMVATVSAAFDYHQDSTMNREHWPSSNGQDSNGHGPYGYAGYSSENGSHVTHMPPRAPPTPEKAFHSLHQHSVEPSHVRGNTEFHAFEQSPFTDLANDPIATAVINSSHTEVSDDAVHDTLDSELKPAARTSDADQPRHSINSDPFVDPTIKLSYSDDRTFEDENKQQCYDDYTMQHMGDYGYPLPSWRPPYASPARSHSMYPPPPPRPYPMVYRFGGGGDDCYPYTASLGVRPTMTNARDLPLAPIPAPAINVKRVSTRSKTGVIKKKQSVKKPKPNHVVVAEGTPNYHRQPSHDELSEAKTPRAKAALSVWYDRLADLQEYKILHGDCNVPQKYDENPALGIWVNKQRMEKKFMDEGQKSSMTWAKLQALDDIGFMWAKRKVSHLFGPWWQSP